MRERKLLWLLSFAVGLSLLLAVSRDSSSTATRRLSAQGTTSKKNSVYLSTVDHPVGRQQLASLRRNSELNVVALTLLEQRAYVERCHAVEAFDRLPEHLQTEIWKYCALSSNGGIYIDATSPLLTELSSHLYTKNVAILGSYVSQTIHGALLILQDSAIAHKMLQVLTETDPLLLQHEPLLLPRALHALIAQQIKKQPIVGDNNGNWYLLEQSCHDALRKPQDSSKPSWTDTRSYRLAHHCPNKSGYCCSILDDQQQVFMMTRHPLMPYQIILQDSLPKPYNAEAGHYKEDELPFITTIREQVFQRTSADIKAPNFFDTLLQNDCLPDSDDCTQCLRNKSGADCHKCGRVCSCYCKALCREQPDRKFVSKRLLVSPPRYSRDPDRLIPRIVHQTWFEPLSKQKYPNMSRLVESFHQSGWEYKFYTDDEAGNFLSTHFSHEVRQAYDSLRPGAFKADLFRYCVLLIHGGVYADVDVQLESSLDAAVPPDVGFMVPIDEPGAPVHKRMCLWNGLIAASPGHPYLIKAIETVVNQVRNRFTSVDTDATFCPEPELSILHAFDTLFTAGPCLLGASLNRVLGRHGQTSFVAGELNHGDENIPGRTIILHQNKWDMGAHRFTYLDRNLVVAATDLPDSNDREQLQNKGSNGGGEHYSKTHAKTGIYGLEGLYVNSNKADEVIVMEMDLFKIPNQVAIA